jgi:hypothetical protein
MSKILRRPMFRGGGKVSSYGNGIATGLADGGMPDKRGLVDGPGGYAGEYRFGETGLGKTLGGIGAIRPAFYDIFNTIANKGSEFLTGYNPGLSYNKQLRSERDLKDKMMGNDPLKRSDRMTDEEVDYTNFLFMKPNAKTGFTTPSMQEEKPEVVEENKISAAELALMEKNKSLTDQLNSFLNPENKKDTKKEAVAAIQERQELMEEVMGGGKSARIADASDMALNYASGALKEGATVKSSFADFFEKESSRPSRSQKIKDAAANAAIQAYLTEKISEKDFSKQMALITGQAKIKQKFADAAKSNLSVQDYVTARGASVSKSEAIENGARGMVENNDQYKSFEKIDSKDNVPELLVKENIGVVFLDSKTKEVFVVTVLEDGTVGKKVLYN